jgi:hypothetical protein
MPSHRATHPYGALYAPDRRATAAAAVHFRPSSGTRTPRAAAERPK